MTPRSTSPTTARRRSRALTLLLALATALGIALVPGTASASGTVLPLADCYAQNSDGTLTVVFGYDNTTADTVTIPVGSSNTFNPTTYNSALPTTFDAGEHHGVFSVTFPQSELYNNPYWYLDGSTLGTATSVPACSASQLPMVANGAAVLALLALAGVVGALVVRRQRRPAVAVAVAVADRG